MNSEHCVFCGTDKDLMPYLTLKICPACSERLEIFVREFIEGEDNETNH